MWQRRPPAPLEVTVYFIRSTERSSTLAPVTREMPVERSNPVDEEHTVLLHLEAAFAALREGPTEAERAQGLSSAFPPEARRLALKVAGDEVTVNLNAAFAAGGDTALMQGRLFQLLYSR